VTAYLALAKLAKVGGLFPVAFSELRTGVHKLKGPEAAKTVAKRFDRCGSTISEEHLGRFECQGGDGERTCRMLPSGR
jgi:hypothetical protein